MESPRKRPSRFVRWTGIAVLVVLAFAAGSALRLAWAPVALPGWAVERIETRVNRDLRDAEARVGQVALTYDLEAQKLRFVLRGASLARGGAPLARLPEARVALDGPSLLRGRLRPRTLAVDGLELAAARDASGRWSLDFGNGGGAMPRDWAAALAVLDRVLGAPVLARLDEVRIADVRVGLSDAITGLAQEVGGTATLTRDGGETRLVLDAALPALGADLDAEIWRDADGLGAEARLAGVRLGALADALPQVRALSLARGEVAAEAAFGVDAAGAPGAVEGRVTVLGASATDRPRMRADRIAMALAWTPGEDVVAVRELTSSSDELSLAATGQVILEEGVTGPVQLQLRLAEATFDPEGMFERRVAFGDGVIEARLTQAPLALDVGQAMVTGPSGTARARAKLAFPAGGISGTVDVTVPQMAVGDLRALWPETLAPQARRWFSNNMLGGIAEDVTAALRLTPGAPPDLGASLSFRDGRFRYMRRMPPAEGAVGAAQFAGGRATIRVDRAHVPAEGPDGASGDGLIDIAGTRLVLPDALSQPPEGRLSLQARGRIGDVLELLDNRPFRLLERLRKTRDLASGEARAEVEVVLPLRPGNAPADIDWSVEAVLEDAVSDEIVPGRRIEAEALRLTADAGAVEIGGAMRFDGVPFEGSWRQALPPPDTEPGDPDAPPPPPVPLPEPGRVRGTASVTPEALDRLGIALPAARLSGRTDVTLDIALPQGAPPRIEARSRMVGMAARIPAISWSKGPGTAADLEVDAVLGPVPEVTRIALDAPGLEAEGSVSLRDDRTLREARLSRVETPFFRGPVTFEGRGRGRAPAISLRGGRADLQRALDAIEGQGGGGGGDPAPISVALDRLQVTEGIALDGLRARLRAGAGEFSGKVNGGELVAGTLTPRGSGTAVQVRSDDAGAVLRAAGLFRDARGGAMVLTMQSTGQEGVLQGGLRGQNLRVRDAPALASLLQTLSVVGLVEQLGGQGLPFTTVEADFVLRPGDIVVRRASAVGPSMSITADGTYDLGSKRFDIEGVVSPIYFVNGLFGALFSRRDEGLFGFTYRMTGAVADPQVAVNPLSILTPGRFRDIFRSAPPTQ